MTGPMLGWGGAVSSAALCEASPTPFPSPSPEGEGLTEVQFVGRVLISPIDTKLITGTSS